MYVSQNQVDLRRPRPGLSRRLLIGIVACIVSLGCDTNSDAPSADATTDMDAALMSDIQTGIDVSPMADTHIDMHASPLPDAQTDMGISPVPDAHVDVQVPDNPCGHRVVPSIINFGFNVVVDTSGRAQRPQGRPLQEGWRLEESPTEIDDHNGREYARIASYMMPIRDALICDIATLDRDDWLAMTQILTLNDIKREQSLTGRPPERFYSTEGIYDLLKTGENFHPMMKYLEEAELELKCIAFQEFDFTNPAGNDHCAIHHLPVGQGLVIPQ